MKFILCPSALFLFAAPLVSAGRPQVKNLTLGRKKRGNRKLDGSRSSSNDGDCQQCPFDVFYHYENENSFRGAFFGPPSGCVLAAIRDEESRRGAQYAIPDGRIALTQGYFPIDDYVEQCDVDNAKETDGVVAGCEEDYISYFTNYEDSDVLDDDNCWVDIDFGIEEGIDDGLLFAAIGSDGLLRPVKSWQTDPDNFGFDGAVYECCPDINDACEIPPEESDD